MPDGGLLLLNGPKCGANLRIVRRGLLRRETRMAKEEGGIRGARPANSSFPGKYKRLC